MALEGVTDEERHALFDHLEEELGVSKYGFDMYDEGYNVGYACGYARCKVDMLRKINAYIERQESLERRLENFEEEGRQVDGRKD